MIFKLKTSKKTEEIFNTIQGSLGLAPYVLTKIALALSIKTSSKLNENDYSSNNFGLELNRQQITGEYDAVFKALIIMNEEKSLTDEEYFPVIVKAHLDRGAKLLEAEFKYGNNLYEHLANLEKGI